MINLEDELPVEHSKDPIGRQELDDEARILKLLDTTTMPLSVHKQSDGTCITSSPQSICTTAYAAPSTCSSGRLKISTPSHPHSGSSLQPNRNILIRLPTQLRLYLQPSRRIVLIHDHLHQLDLVRLGEVGVVEKRRELVFRADSVGLGGFAFGAAESREEGSPAPRGAEKGG